MFYNTNNKITQKTIYEAAYNKKNMKHRYTLKYKSGGNVRYEEDIDCNWVKYYYYKNDCLAYTIHSNGCWEKRRYDSNGNLTYIENSDKYWEVREYDEYMNETYREHSFGYWWRRKWDNQNRFVSYESHTGEWYKYHYDENGDAYKEYPTSNGKAMKINSKTYQPIWKEVSSFK
jgi:hypothetical protein